MALTACRDSGPNTQPLTPELDAVMAQVAELRGLPPARDIEAGTVKREDVRKLLSESLSGEDRETFGTLTTLYRLMGLIGGEDDYESLYLDFAAGAVIGFYEPADERFWVVSEESEVDFESFDATLRSTVAHEFVHALQDEAFDLEDLLARSSADLDWSLGLSAVLEGDASFHERPGHWRTSLARTPEEFPAKPSRRAEFQQRSSESFVSPTKRASIGRASPAPRLATN